MSLPLAGNITGSRFSGGTTGCAFPDDSTETILAPDGVTQIAVPMGVPNSLALGPDGNLYIGFKKQGGILRINNPATATRLALVLALTLFSLSPKRRAAAVMV